MESKEERRDMVKRMICDKKREEKRRKEKKSTQGESMQCAVNKI